MLEQREEIGVREIDSTSVSAKASTFPKDSILVKSGPSPVIATLTEMTRKPYFTYQLEHVYCRSLRLNLLA